MGYLLVAVFVRFSSQFVSTHLQPWVERGSFNLTYEQSRPPANCSGALSCSLLALDRLQSLQRELKLTLLEPELFFAWYQDFKGLNVPFFFLDISLCCPYFHNVQKLIFTCKPLVVTTVLSFICFFNVFFFFFFFYFFVMIIIFFHL